MMIASLCEAQAPVDTVSRLAAINRHYVRIGRAQGESIWPGFRPDTVPVVYVLPNRGSALFNWPGSFPDGYTAVVGVDGAAWKDERALGAASTGITIASHPAAQVVVSSIDPASLLPTAVHEAFHVFERASIRPNLRFGRGENAFYVSSYPVFDVENEKMFALEGRLLRQALSATTSERRRELAREFVAVRRARHRPLDPSFAEFDGASELNEGLAEYALVRALKAMADDPALPAEWRASARQQMTDQIDRLASLTTNVAQSFRLRFYATGPGQALLLDAISPSWKGGFAERNQTLTDALALALVMDGAERAALQRALRREDTARAGVEAAAAVARLRALRTRQVDSILAQPGILLELDASEMPSKDFGFCGFDPQNHLQVTPTVQLQTRWWRPCAGSALTSEFNVPSVHDDERGTVRAIVGAESDLRLTSDGKPLTLSNDQRVDLVTNLKLYTPRVTVQAARARIAREGRVIRITPLPPS